MRLAAAYLPAAALSVFHREFWYEAPGLFRVRDQIETNEPRSFEWFLHADQPFRAKGAAVIG